MPFKDKSEDVHTMKLLKGHSINLELHKFGNLQEYIFEREEYIGASYIKYPHLLPHHRFLHYPQCNSITTTVSW